MVDELRAALTNLKEAIVNRPIHAVPVKTVHPVHVFTDGACEPNEAGILEGTIGEGGGLA